MHLSLASAGVPRLRVGLVWAAATPDPVSIRQSLMAANFAAAIGARLVDQKARPNSLRFLRGQSNRSVIFGSR